MMEVESIILRGIDTLDTELPSLHGLLVPKAQTCSPIQIQQLEHTGLFPLLSLGAQLILSSESIALTHGALVLKPDRNHIG